MRAIASIASLVVTFLLGACATSPSVPDAARSELAPTGKLRAGMNLGNKLFITKDAATGELRGVSVDLNPAALASSAGNITQTLVQTPAMISVFRPVARTVLTKSSLSQAFTSPLRGT